MTADSPIVTGALALGGLVVVALGLGLAGIIASAACARTLTRGQVRALMARKGSKA